MRTRIAFCLIALLLPSRLFAQALADRIPGDATVYVGWRGTDDMGAGYADSHLKAMVDQSNVGQLIHETIPQLITKYGGKEQDVADVLHVLQTVGVSMWRHPSALFVGKLEVANGQPAPPQAGILCLAGQDAAALQGELQNQLQKIPSPIPLQVVRMGDLVVIGIDYEQGKVELPDGHDGKSLSDSATFKTAMAQVTKDPVLAVYVDGAALVKFGDEFSAGSSDPQFKENWPKIRDQIGLAGLGQFAIGSGFDGKNWGTTAFLGAAAPRTGLLAAFDTQPIPDSLLQTIPETSMVAGAGRFDLANLVKAIRSFATGLDPSSQQEIDGFMQNISQAVGVDVEKELLPTFGDEWSYYIDPVTAGKSSLGIAIVNHLRDPQHAAETLQKFQAGLQQLAAQQIPEKNIHIEFRKTTIDGIEVNYLAIPVVTPSWTVQGDYLCIGLYPQVAASAAKHIAGHGKSILENKDFVELRQHLGGDKATSIRYSDLRVTAPEGYGTWRLIASLDLFADVFGVAAPPALLPSLDKMMQHLSAAGQVTWTDAQGFHSRGVTPFPGATLLASDPASMGAYSIPLEISILLPALNRAREQANRVKSASNLRQIGLGALMFANDNKEAFPATLGEMAAKEDLTPSVFINPRGKSPSPPANLTGAATSDWINQNSDYVWLGAGKKSTNVGPDVILAYEKPAGLKDGINFLYGDGHVEFQIMPIAQDLIQKANPRPPLD